MPGKYRLSVITASVATAIAVSPGPALADRPPSAQERTRIETVLRAQGYVRWGDIELDDGRWEVDDAVARDGRRYDLELSRRTLKVLDRDRDD